MSNYSHSVSLQTLLTSKSGINNSELIELGMKCAASAHNLTISAQNLHRKKIGNNSQDFLSQISQSISGIFDLWKGPTGIEISSFPMMRKHIQLQYLTPISSSGSINISSPNNLNSDILERYQSRVCRLTIQGCDSNIIDGILIAHSRVSIEIIRSINNKSQTTNPSNSLIYDPIVLFCCPNAGFYEGLVMAQSSSSWLGFYLARGFLLITPLKFY